LHAEHTNAILTSTQWSPQRGCCRGCGVNVFFTDLRQSVGMERRPRLSELPPEQILERAAELYVMAETAVPLWVRDSLLRSAKRLEQYLQRAEKSRADAEAGIQAAQGNS
jgi:hypothetical protein